MGNPVKNPDFSFEEKLWGEGNQLVVGLDEVGRGAFAGPLMVGATIFSYPKSSLLGKVKDSKLLKPQQRFKIAPKIKSKALAWTVSSSEVSEIDRLGVGKATQLAMRKAVVSLNQWVKSAGLGEIDFLLIDGFNISCLPGFGKSRQLAIKKGDQKSVSIAAASILAKLERDRLMKRLSRNPQYKVYGWGKNKGYGTKKHRLAIKKFGPTNWHRQDFIRSWT
jgi:ribonuclease HII